MRVRFMSLILICVTAVTLALAAQTTPAQTLLEAARKLEVVDGDVKGAIQQYQAIVDRYAKSERAVAAQALLLMAQAYEKMGDARAQQTYEQVVRDFSDQPEVVSQARTSARPAGGASTQARVTARLSWQEELYSRVSAGGRFLAYVNWWEAGDLYLRDLHSGSSRALTRESPVTRNVSVGGAAVSDDERRVAYSWEFSDHYELRVVDLSESGVPRSRVVMSSAEYLVPSDWTPDGKEILVERARPDRTRQIVAVNLESGNVRALKTVDWRGTHGLYVSPDGRFVAFSRAGSETTERADIEVLALDGSRGVVAVDDPAFDELLGWSADGKQLLFASDRGGRTGLWTIAMVEGRAVGAPRLVRADIGPIVPRGVTRAGAITYEVPLFSGVAYLKMTSFDFESETASPPTTVATGSGAYSGSGITWKHTWSPDGSYLAYLPEPQGLGRNSGRMKVLAIRTMATGEVREVELQMHMLWSNLAWSPDGRSLVVAGQDFKGRWGMHRVDPRTGDTTPIALAGPEQADPHFSYRTLSWSPDGQRLYFRRLIRTGPRTFDQAILRFDLATGRETELLHVPGSNGYGVYGDWIAVSPDGRYLAVKVPSTSEQREPLRCAGTGCEILLVPTDGTPSRELASASAPASLGVLTWAPDSRSVFVKQRHGEVVETWRYGLDGTKHRVVDATLDHIDGVGLGVVGYAPVAPDGRHLAFAEFERAGPGVSLTEIWTVDHIFD